VAATNFMIAMTGAMLVYGQVRASVISAIACRTLASAILPEFLTFITRAQPRWCSCERDICYSRTGVGTIANTARKSACATKH
jgi:hypothetical protein